MEWLLAAMAVVAIALAAVASTGRGGGMPDLVDDREAPELPSGDLVAADLRSVRFAVVPRGYSMTQVDDLLSRLATQLSDDRTDPEPFEIDQVPARRPAVATPSAQAEELSDDPDEPAPDDR